MGSWDGGAGGGALRGRGDDPPPMWRNGQIVGSWDRGSAHGTSRAMDK